MKTLIPILASSALICVGCVAKQEPVFNSPPGPSPGIAGDLPASSPPPPPPPPVKEKKKTSANKPEVIVTPETTLTGKVTVYNAAGQFVVLEFPTGQLPPKDQRMFVYRRGLKVGEVKISGPQQDRHIVADLTTGEAQSGDDVRDK